MGLVALIEILFPLNNSYNTVDCHYEINKIMGLYRNKVGVLSILELVPPTNLRINLNKSML